MRATIAVIVSTIVLAASSPASGACAWVLWVNADAWPPLSPKPSSPISGFSTKAECEAEKERLLSSTSEGTRRFGDSIITPDTHEDVSPPPPPRREPGVYGPYHFRGSPPMIISYKCLPDTIDPRGPKREGSR